ncbi:MAG: Na(+)-translocating NADH-quinone reductase subunit C [bacterium]|nr:Na(+)-translocating NADH-quinone reductase subunit C [bacterium]
MQRSGTLYTLVFAAVVCVACSVLVCGAAVALRNRQEANVILDRQTQVLLVSGLVDRGDKPKSNRIQELFDANIEVHAVNLETGAYADDDVQQPFDMVKASTNPELGHKAPANPALVKDLPKYATVHQVVKDGEVDMVILQVWGEGLWNTMYGYLALDKDGETIRGLTFYDQGETPGLGAEVLNPKWVDRWPGRKAFDDSGAPAIAMRKGGAGTVEDDPHGFDGLSGATITSRAVESLLNFWLGDAGYGPYLEQFRKDRG